MNDFVERVVSKEKSWFEFINSSILLSINLPASIETFSGWNGERPRAISSAFTNSLQLRRLGRMLNEAVVFPAPLQPLIMYSFLSCMLKGRELYSYSKLRVAANGLRAGTETAF